MNHQPNTPASLNEAVADAASVIEARRRMAANGNRLIQRLCEFADLPKESLDYLKSVHAGMSARCRSGYASEPPYESVVEILKQRGLFEWADTKDGRLTFDPFDFLVELSKAISNRALAAPAAAIDAREPVVTDDMRSLANYYINAKQPTREEVEAEEVADAELEPMVERLHKGMRALASREATAAVTCKAEQSRWGAHLYICDGKDCDRCTRTAASRSETPAPSAAIDAREQEDAATLLSKYKKLCVEVGQGDGYHLARIDRAISSLASCEEAPVASGEEVRECGNGECGWKGVTDRMLGAVGPLCPKCGETTELASPSGAGLGGAVASSEAVGWEDATERYLADIIRRSPEPLRELGDWLATKLDEDEWKTAERYVLGAMESIVNPSALASQPGCAVEGEALSPATVAQPVGVQERFEQWARQRGHDTHRSSGTGYLVYSVQVMWMAWQEAAQPCASQGCGGAVQEAVANVVSCWNRFRWSKETSDAVSALAALSTAPRSLDGATPGGKE